jgi:hypothetical protein
MVNLYPKAFAIAALLSFQGLQAQIGISYDVNFRPNQADIDNGVALSVDGKLNVRGSFKTTNEPNRSIGNGQNGQVLQMKNISGQLQPQWVNPPVSLLEEGMFYIENTFTTTSTSGAIFPSNLSGSYVETNIDAESYENGWIKIADFKENGISKNFNIVKSSNNLNIHIETGVQIRNSTGAAMTNSNNASYVCGLFSKSNGLGDNTAKLKAYRIGQINAITNQTTQHSNFNLLYTIKDFPIGQYNFFVACKKMSQSGSNIELRIGSPNHEHITQFTDRPIVKLDILYQL